MSGPSDVDTPRDMPRDIPGTPLDPDGGAGIAVSVVDAGDDEVVVLPWWRNPVTIVTAVLGLLLLAATGGYVVGHNSALPDPNSTDVGFLQDMRVHHEQAVEMSSIFLASPGANRGLQTVAATILYEQQLEIGRFVQLLRDLGESEVNETDLAMSWMGEPVPIERMPGMATPEDLVALRAASGSAADELFVRLMTAHHLGGVHMAEHAGEHAATSEVRRIAAQIVRGQTEEVAELEMLLDRSRT